MIYNLDNVSLYKVLILFDQKKKIPTRTKWWLSQQ